VAGEIVLVVALAALSPAALRDARSLVRQALASFRS
jgi:hypothetical protein